MSVAGLCGLVLVGACDEGEVIDEAELERQCQDNPDCVDGVHPSLMSPDDPEAQPTLEEAFPSVDVDLEHGFLRTESGILEVGARRVGEHVAVGGDMLFTAEQFDASFFATLEEAQAEPELPAGVSAAAVRPLGSAAWPGGVVPYAIDPSLDDVDRVYDAIAVWEENTPFWFAERSSCVPGSSCVLFTDGDGCSSFVGRTGGVQAVTLQNGYCNMGSAIHEIGHAVGFWHEHTRTDRDAYVTIHWDNIEDGKEYNFERYVDRGFSGSDVGPYDFDSIMHYGSTDFGKRVWGFLWKQTTISTHGGESIGQRDHLSTGDIAAAFLRFNPKKVIAFSGTNYQGDWQAFDPGTHYANQGDLSGVGNDTVSSLLIPPGYHVSLCAHENAGPCQSYTANTPYVGSTLNNNTSRIQIGGMVTVFEDMNYSGPSETFGWGDHWANEFTTLGNDRASSLVVGPGVQVTVCAHEQAGPCESYGPDTRIWQLPGSVDNQVSRVQVSPLFTPIPIAPLEPIAEFP